MHDGLRIAVVGGGPAGGSAALALARGGAAVTLYLPERPGEKPCGGAVPEHLLPVIEGFDPALLDAIVAPPLHLEDGAGSSLDSTLDGIRIFRRRDFDKTVVAAAAAAGAAIEPCRVEALVPLAGPRGAIGVRVEGSGCPSRTFDWVVGADGARGLSRRIAGLTPQGESIGLGATLRGLPAARLVLSFPYLGDSYSWIFPRPGGASVGIAYSPADIGEAAARSVLDALLERYLPADWRRLPGSRYRYPIPIYGPWTVPGVRRALQRRLLLVGDAAALADPLTREGIRYGMLSGLWAAQSLLAGAPERYPDRLAAELADEMERADRARGLFFAGPVGRWMLPAARLHRGVRRVLSDLLSCRQSYRTLESRLLREALHP